MPEPIPTGPPVLGREGLQGPPTLIGDRPDYEAVAVAEPPPPVVDEGSFGVRLTSGLLGAAVCTVTSVLAMSFPIALGASDELIETKDLVIGLVVILGTGSALSTPLYYFSADRRRSPGDRWTRAGVAALGFLLTFAAVVTVLGVGRWVLFTSRFPFLGDRGLPLLLLDFAVFLVGPTVTATFAALWLTEVAGRSRRVALQVS